MSARLRNQDGWAMVTAITLMFLMVSIGLASAALIDTQTQKSARERLDESSFNLAEGAVTAEGYLLTRSWPGGSSTAYPTSCTQASVQANCPDPNLVKTNYATADYHGAPQWTVQVRDNVSSNGSSEFYSDSATAAAPHYDSNRDGKVWVRATATVSNKTRAIVGLVQVDSQPEDLPKAALLAGSLNISNNGNKPMICTKLPDNPLGNDCSPSSSTQTGAVEVRCTELIPGVINPACLNERSSGVQISPHNVTYGYSGGNGLTPDALNRLRSAAIANGTYYTSCPASMAGPQAGMVVFVDLSGGNCPYQSNSNFNTQSQPGVFIINNGTLTLRGNAVFYGVIYSANPPALPPAVDLEGNISVIGGISIDGSGQMVAGSSKINLIFDPHAFDAVASYGAAHLVQNKWREFVPSGG